MADKDKDEGGLMSMLGFGAAKKAAKDLAGRKAKLEAAEKEAIGPAAPDPDKGVDAGELGKKWEDRFHF